MLVRAVVIAVCLAFVAASASALAPKSTVATHDISNRVVVEIDGANYTIALTNVPWADAKTACTALNQRLIVLDTRVKAQFWLDYLRDNPQYDTWTWIDGRRGPGEAEYVWQATGMPFDENETLWGIGQPNSSNTYGQCVNFAGAAPSGGWEDENCAAYALSYICEDIPAAK